MNTDNVKGTYFYLFLSYLCRLTINLHSKKSENMLYAARKRDFNNEN